MEKKIYRIEPVKEERMWGGQDIINKWGYKTDLKNIAELYACVAIPNHLDCDVIDTGEKLSDFYHKYRDELFGSNTDDVPIRLTIESAIDNMSVQIHPEDDYALEHFGQYGKPGGILYLEGKDVDLLLGHHAQSKEQFIEWNENQEYDKLFRFVDYVPGDYIHIPANTLHSFRIRGIMIAFARNSDVTLRLYDYGRMDPKTGLPRKMHVNEVYENITIPDDSITTTRGEVEVIGNIKHTHYYDKAGEYTGGRVEVKDNGEFELKEFYFMFCISGAGKVGSVDFKAGDVLFVPKEFGKVKFEGDLDFVYCSYKNK